MKTNSHMKWCGFGTEPSSGLHCTNQYWSTDHLVDRSLNRLYRVHSGYKFESHVTEFGSHEQVQNAATHNRSHREEGNQYTPKHLCT